MSTKAVFTMKLEPELRETFMAEAASADRPASQVVRELMRDYIERRRQSREYDEYLCRKVDRARGQIVAGQHFLQDEVEAEAEARRAAFLRQANKDRL